MAEALMHSGVARELERLCAQARVPQLRTMRAFAEETLRFAPGSPRPGPFRVKTQPFTKLWFEAIDSGQWTKYNATGPSQSSKTVIGSITPVLYHLFEYGETVIYGVPTLDIVNDKWNEVLRPAIEESAYKHQIPRIGRGSRGGLPVALSFRSGVTLRFMTGGGDDKHRAAYTARVLVITETDGFDVIGTTSRESTKIAQLVARTRGFGDRARTYSECTVGIEEGYTWQTHQQGTATRIMLPCPHCRAYVLPEREHLIGWQEAETKVDAYEAGAFACPECGKPWSEAQRYQANLGGVLLHRGQEIDRHGRVHGPLPRTDTFSLRWSAVHNMLVTAGYLAAGEWQAGQASDEEAADREQCQFVWAVPPKPLISATTPLEAQALTRRVSKLARGLLPEDTQALTLGVDIGKWHSYWLAIAWRADGRGHVPSYGLIEVHSDELGEEAGIRGALREMREMVLGGWPQQGQVEPRVPDQVWIDARYKGDLIYAFVRESREQLGQEVFRSVLGFGVGQRYQRGYTRPKAVGGQIAHVGDEYHIVRFSAKRVYVVEINADAWKGRVHERLGRPLDAEGALSFFHTLDPNEHHKLAKHLTAERPVEEFVPGKGTRTRWQVIRRANHYLDCTYIAACAGAFCGIGAAAAEEETEPVASYAAAQPGGWKIGR